MNAVPGFRIRRIVRLTRMVSVLSLALASPGLASSYGRTSEKAVASTVKVSLSEWKSSFLPPASRRAR
jgi:hypothetical protein